LFEEWLQLSGCLNNKKNNLAFFMKQRTVMPVLADVGLNLDDKG